MQTKTHICLSVCPVCPSVSHHVYSVVAAVVDGFFPYWTQVITSMGGCVMHNDLCPWPMPSRSFSQNFAIRLPKYDASCCVSSTTYTVLDGLFSYLAQMITSMRGCFMDNDISPWPLCLRSFSNGFAVKLIKYGTYHCVCSTAHTVLDGFITIFSIGILDSRRCSKIGDILDLSSLLVD